MTVADRQNLPNYCNPPVIEVAYGVSFNPLTALKAPHTGVFWSSIRDAFPEVQHAVPVGPLPKEFDMGNLPLPRIWFISEDENYLVQLQNNRFLYNWRIMRPSDAYPRFEAVQKGFKKYFALFENFVESAGLGDLELQSYELTYINHIERKGKYKNPRHISAIFPDLRWKFPAKRFLPIPSHLTWSVGFEFGEKGRLAANLKTAYRNSDQQELFVLDLKATGKATIEGNENVNVWFDQAREWIVRGFEDLTSERAQTDLWGKESLDG